MLRYICRVDHAVFARHYLNHARMLDRQTAHSLRQDVQQARRVKKSLEEIPSPRMNMNAGAFWRTSNVKDYEPDLKKLPPLSTYMPAGH
jgi:hypothetical protein